MAVSLPQARFVVCDFAPQGGANRGSAC